MRDLAIFGAPIRGTRRAIEALGAHSFGEWCRRALFCHESVVVPIQKLGCDILAEHCLRLESQVAKLDILSWVSRRESGFCGITFFLEISPLVFERILF